MFKARHRVMLRFAVRKMTKQGKITHEQAQQVLDDDLLADAVLASAEEIEDKDPVMGKKKVGDLASFFEWLMAHMDEIIAIIMKLIALAP